MSNSPLGPNIGVSNYIHLSKKNNNSTYLFSIQISQLRGSFVFNIRYVTLTLPYPETPIYLQIDG